MADFANFSFTTQETWYGEISFLNGDADNAPLSLAGRSFEMLVTPAGQGGSLLEPARTLTMQSGGGLQFKTGGTDTLLFRVDGEIARRDFARVEYTADILEVVDGERHLFMPVRVRYSEPSGLISFVPRLVGVSVTFSARRQPIVTPVAITGRQGIPGATILTGTVPPVPATGKDGDYFIEDRTASSQGRRMYGPKAGGAWPGTPWVIQVAGIADVPGLSSGGRVRSALVPGSDRQNLLRNGSFDLPLTEDWGRLLNGPVIVGAGTTPAIPDGLPALNAVRLARAAAEVSLVHQSAFLDGTGVECQAGDVFRFEFWVHSDAAASAIAVDLLRRDASGSIVGLASSYTPSTVSAGAATKVVAVSTAVPAPGRMFLRVINRTDNSVVHVAAIRYQRMNAADLIPPTARIPAVVKTVNDMLGLDAAADPKLGAGKVSQSGIGAIPEELQEVLRRTVCVDSWISNPSSSADRRSAFDRAFARLGSAGGVVRMAPGVDYPISGLDVPSMCSIQGPYKHIDTYADGVIHKTHGTFRTHRGLVLDPTGTIKLNASSFVLDSFIRRAGWTYQEADSSQFAGDAITSTGYGAGAISVMAIGFDYLFKSAVNNGTRQFIHKFFGDGNNGVSLGRSADPSRVFHVHLWCFGTIEGFIAAGAAATQAQLTRSGTALECVGGLTGSEINDWFSLGYKRGLKATTASLGKFGHVRFEGTEALIDEDGVYAVDFGANTDLNHIDHLSIVGYPRGLRQVGGSGTRLTVGFCEQHKMTGPLVTIDSGNIKILDLSEWTCTNGPAVVINNTTSTVEIDGNLRSNIPPLVAPTGGRTDLIKVTLRTVKANGGSILDGGTLVTPSCPDAAGVVDLPPNASSIRLGGNTPLATINGHWTDRVVSILFAVAREIVPGGNIAVTSPVTIPANTLISFRASQDGLWRSPGLPRVLERAIPNDGVTSLRPPATTGFLSVRAAGSGTGFGGVHFRVGTTGQLIANVWTPGSQFALGTAGTNLSGTTGATSRLTVAPGNDGQIYIENRLGTAVTVRLEFLN